MLSTGEEVVARYVPSAPSEGFAPNFVRHDHGFWSSLPRTFRIDPSVSGHDRKLIREGILRWFEATGGRAGLVEVTGSELEDVTVGFGPLPKDREGETTTTTAKQPDGRHLLLKARIVLADRLLGARAANRDVAIMTVACHEAGHALGIFSQTDQGHSPFKDDMMSPRVELGNQWPSPRDLNTLASIYRNRFEGRDRDLKRR